MVYYRDTSVQIKIMAKNIEDNKEPITTAEFIVVAAESVARLLTTPDTTDLEEYEAQDLRDSYSLHKGTSILIVLTATATSIHYNHGIVTMGATIASLIGLGLITSNYSAIIENSRNEE